jgi:hypothetical protein
VALAEIRYPDGTSEQIVPDKYGRALEYKDRSGLITRYYYEPFPTERECRAAYGVLGR